MILSPSVPPQPAYGPSLMHSLKYLFFLKKGGAAKSGHQALSLPDQGRPCVRTLWFDSKSSKELGKVRKL